MERLTDELANAKTFFLRIVKFQGIAMLFLLCGLAPGIAGFSIFEGLSMHDALLNCISMLGSVDIPHRPGSLSGLYFIALYGVFLDSVFLVSLGTVMAPFVHRVLHRCNLGAD